jgi:hypothetical protein
MYDINKVAFRKAETVSLKMTNTTTLKYLFGDIEKLRGVFIRAVEFFKVGSVARSWDDLAVVNDVVFNKAAMTLSIKGTEDISRIPLYCTTRDVNNGTPLLLDWLQVDFPKSFIDFPNATGTVANEAFYCVFYYVKADELPEHVKQRYGIKSTQSPMSSAIPRPAGHR